MRRADAVTFVGNWKNGNLSDENRLVLNSNGSVSFQNKSNY